MGAGVQVEVFRDTRGDAVEEALAEAARWLRRADDLADTADRRKHEDTALLVHAYAMAADVHTRVAEIRAALDGHLVAAVESHAARERARAIQDVERRRERRESGGPIPRDV